MKKSSIAILLILNGFAYFGVWLIPYIYASYYSALQEALNLTNAQIGLFGSITGILGIFGYFVSGILADLVSAKKLMIATYAVNALLAVIYSFFPPYGVLLVLQALSCLATQCMFWAAMGKYVKALSNENNQGRMFGLHFGCIGVGSALFGVLGGIFVGKFGSVVGLSMICRMSAVLLIVGILANAFLFKEEKEENRYKEAGKKGEGFSLKNIAIILKVPDFWLITLAMFGIYLSFAMTTYFVPMLNTVYGVPLAIVTILGPLRAQAAKIIAGPIGGVLMDKLKSGTRLAYYVSIALFIMGLAIIFLPKNLGMVTLVGVLIIFVILVLASNVFSPVMFVMIDELKMPEKIAGTTIGLASSLAMISDAFIYTLVGSWLDKMGDTAGYNLTFSICTGAFFVSMICIAIVLKKRKNQITEMAAPVGE